MRDFGRFAARLPTTIDVNLEEVDISRESLSEEGDADEEDSDGWCDVVCGLVKGRLCWEKLGDGCSKCIRRRQFDSCFHFMTR